MMPRTSPSGPAGRGARPSPPVAVSSNQDRKPLQVGSNQMELLEFGMLEVQGPGRTYESLFGINVYKIRHVINWPTIHTIPGASDHLLGIFGYRSAEIPLVDLRSCLKLAPRPPEAERMVVIAELNGIQVGFAVDSPKRVRRISWSHIKKPPENQAETLYRWIMGLALIEDQLIRILDAELIIAELGMGAAAKVHERVAETIQKIAADPVEPERAPASEETAPGPANIPSSDLIMVVDDSAMLRNMISSLFEGASFKVLKAKDGQDAWERIEQIRLQARQQGKNVPDIVPLAILDVEMPRMDGFTLTRKIKTDPELAPMKVILHTSLGGDENMRKGREVGADDFAVKFNPDALLALIRGHLKRS